MALAATGSPDVAERVTEASALELKLVGINWAYSPVADVNSDPRNPIIGPFLSTCHAIARTHIPPCRCTVVWRRYTYTFKHYVLLIAYFYKSHKRSRNT